METLEKKIRQVRVRCSIDLLLQQLTRSLLFVGMVVAVVILAERLFAVRVMNRWSVGALVGRMSGRQFRSADSAPFWRPVRRTWSSPG